MSDRTKQTISYGVLLLLVLVLLFSLGLSNHGLWTADEPRVAEIGREMALTGNWVVPTLNRKPFLEQPPLYYASLATVFRAFGQASDRVARIPSAVFALAGAIALFFLGTMLLGPRVGFLSAFILGTSFEYFRVAHWVLVDSALTCFVISAMTFFIAGYHAGKPGRKTLFYVLFYFFCGLAFYSKGFIGLVIPGLGIVAFLIFEKNLKAILQMRLWLGVIIFLVMILPWFFALWHQGGTEHLKVFLLYNHLGRYIPGGVSGHHHPFWYYLIEFPGGFLPWSFLLIPVLYGSFSRAGHPSILSRRGLLFAKCWFFTGFVFLSLAATKRALYLLPIFAPFSILTAYYIDTTLQSRAFLKVEKLFLWISGLLPLGAGLVLTPLYFYLSGKLVPFSWGLAILVLAFSLVMVALSLVALTFLQKWKTGRFWIFASGAFVVLLVFILVGVLPVMDRHKSLVPFCEQVKATVPSDQPLYGYMPDETLRGAVPFYTGHFVEEIEDRGRLDEILKGDDPVFVVTRDKRQELEKEMLSTGRLSILFHYNMGSDRSLLLFTNRPEKTLEKDAQ